jgi:hypothetical protein
MEPSDNPPSATRAFVPGEGNVRERTIRLGNLILAVANIDSVALTMRPRVVGPILFGAVALGALAAAIAHSVNENYWTSASVFAGVLGVGAAIAFLRPLDNLLAVGTSGGRTYLVRSKDKAFLVKLGELIRRKIDADDPALTAEFSDAQDLVEVAGRRGPVRRIVDD